MSFLYTIIKDVYDYFMNPYVKLMVVNLMEMREILDTIGDSKEKEFFLNQYPYGIDHIIIGTNNKELTHIHPNKDIRMYANYWSIKDLFDKGFACDVGLTEFQYQLYVSLIT